jgi:hypothetical protein
MNFYDHDLQQKEGGKWEQDPKYPLFTSYTPILGVTEHLV